MSFPTAHWVTEDERLFRSSAVVISVNFQWLSTTSLKLNEEAATGAVQITIKCVLIKCWKWHLQWIHKLYSIIETVHREQHLLRDRTEPSNTSPLPCPAGSLTYLHLMTIYFFQHLCLLLSHLCVFGKAGLPQSTLFFTSVVTRLCFGSKGLIPKWILRMCNLILHNCWKLEPT